MKSVVSIKDSVERFVAPHEIFLSFTSDLGAEAFEEWLSKEGFNRFKQFCLKNENYYKLF